MNPGHKPPRSFDLGGRLACALGSLLFSLPICGLLWLVFNVWLAGMNLLLAPQWLAWGVGALAALAFVAPKAFAKVTGWLVELLFSAGR